MRQLTKRPTLLTAILSLATLAGYAAYRLTIGGQPEPAGAPAAMVDAMDHAHDDQAGQLPPLADTLPAIVLEDLEGRPTELASFAGKPLLINFWATWCAPCLREIPLLKTFHAEQDLIDVVGIAIDDVDPVLEFAAEIDFNYPSLVGYAEGYEAMAFLRNDAQAMPFSVFTGRGGAVLGKSYGELHAEDLELIAATVGLLEAGSIDIAEARERLATLH